MIGVYVIYFFNLNVLARLQRESIVRILKQ